jgi:hypothetical protein
VQHAADADEHLIKMPGIAGLRSAAQLQTRRRTFGTRFGRSRG